MPRQSSPLTWQDEVGHIIVATGAAPAANPWVHMLQAHIQLDTLVSTQLTTK